VVSLSGATTNGDPRPPTCQTFIANSVWYRFAPSLTALYTISSCADAPTATTLNDTVMAIYNRVGGLRQPVHPDWRDLLPGPGLRR
jgi:hypothetical protein